MVASSLMHAKPEVYAYTHQPLVYLVGDGMISSNPIIFSRLSVTFHSLSLSLPNFVWVPYANAEAASTRIIKHRWVLHVIQINGKDRLYFFFHIHTLTLCQPIIQFVGSELVRKE